MWRAKVARQSRVSCSSSGFPCVGVRQWRSQGRARGHAPQTFGNCFFSPINLCCYVLLMCKWRLPMYFRLTTLKLPPQMSFHQHCFAIVFALGSTHDSTECWNAHRSPATRESFKCVQGWVASAGWHRSGGIDRVASAGCPPPTIILATPVG